MIPALLLALFLQTGAPTRTAEVRITKASKQFDFVLHVTRQGDEDNPEDVISTGWIAVYHKGQARPMQTIPMEDFNVHLPQDSGATVNSTRLYDEQSLLDVGDFNFDGHEDFAVMQNENGGSYGMPSYSVFLFDQHANRFVLNGPMSKLTGETLGFFQVDKVHKQLVTLAKSGCCYHETTRFDVVKDRPLAVYREIEDGTKNERYVYVTTERMVAGKWQRSIKRYLQSQYYK
jgi:hypothetical protein